MRCEQLRQPIFAQEERTMLRTEYEFTLPRGYVDSEGNVHREGVMRLATAKDEIVPLNESWM